MYDDTARIAFATVEALKSARRGAKGMRNEAQHGGCCKVSLCEYALMAVTVLAGIVLLPVLIPLYLIPSIRETFDQLAYEDAMIG